MTTALFAETLHQDYAQQFSVEKVLFEEKTEHFHLIIFQNKMFGKVMALDGIIQTTEKDEFIYHEMLTHVPLFAHPNPRHVCVIGGGDGGMLREVLKHKSIEKVTLVEIDAKVIEMCREYFPGHSDGAFDDGRTEIVIQDGFDYLQPTENKFDVIMSDSTDPVGPGEVLFTEKFYSLCHKALKPGGILTTQNGVSYFQLDEAKNTRRDMLPFFKDVSFYTAAVPTYVGGIMAFGFASDDIALKNIDPVALKKRFDASAISTRYYTPGIHTASFSLPAYMVDALHE